MQAQTPPVAEKHPVEHVAHGDTRVDEYAWLRDRDDQKVIAHLEAENAYTEQVTQHLAPLRERLYKEIVARIQQSDVTAPAPEGTWEYYVRTVEGLEYPIICRRPRGGGPETVVLDQNALAEGHDYTEVGDWETSPDQQLLAYTIDHNGGERFTLRIRDIESGTDLDDTVENVYYTLAWSADSSMVLYTRPDDAMRPHQVLRHAVGTSANEDKLVMREDDEHFFIGVARTRSGRFIVIAVESQVTCEAHILDAHDPAASPVVVSPRRHGIEYRVDHHPGGDGLHGDHLYITTNDQARNFRLVRASVADLDTWTEILPADEDVKLEGVDVFAGFAAIYERRDAVRGLRYCPIVHGHTRTELIEKLIQPEEVSTVVPAENREFATAVLRYEYTSLITPRSTVEHDITIDHRVVVKQQPVLGGYDPENYVSERHWAAAEDGAQIPISLVYHRGTPIDGTAPCLLSAYGAYDHSRDPEFRSIRLSLLDRGFVYAIAHPRGGGEMGRRWYEGGKLLNKRNTFTDFIACGDHLVAEKFTAHDRLAIHGGSAGGLLIGAVLNMRPELAAAAVADVPFVDSLTTMLDASLPLTVIEYDEWGDPNDPAVYPYMRSYSPYDNVHAADYPSILVLTALNDPRVGFWEPVKWVARLRDRTTGVHPILLRAEMGAGHAGPSGRYETWRRDAFIYSWLLDRLPGWEERSS